MPETQAIPDTTSRRVLVVEDEDNIALALQYVIQREGHEFHRIADGAAAEAAIRDLKPDLILLDIMLPQVSGYDICRSVRADPELAATRILMMTARGSAVQRDRALSVGADGLFSKPFGLDDLREKMRAQLSAPR